MKIRNTLWLLLLLSGWTAADVVTLTNGDRMSGTVKSIVNGSVLLNSELFGTLPIPADKVLNIEKTEPMQVETAGSELTGVLAIEDDQQVLRTSGGTQPIAIADLTRAVENYVSATDFDRSWASRLDLGYVLSTGNSETESSAINFESKATRGKFENRAFLNWNRDQADGETTRYQIDGGYGLRYYYRPQWYTVGNIGYFKDELKNIDQRITVGLSVGYQFFDTSISSLSTELGINQVFEDLNGDRESNPAARWGLNYQRWLQPERIEYFYGHEILTIFASNRGEVYKANTGIRFKLTDFWSAHARVDAVHETKPPEGAEKTDLIYTFGFGFTF